MSDVDLTEEWRPVVGVPPFDGVYAVSNLGRVRRNLTVKGKSAGTKITPRVNEGGYLRARLRHQSTVKCFFIHKLVALAFIGPCPPLCEVNHKNFNRSDNRALNLEYCTKKQNSLHTAMSGRAGKVVSIETAKAIKWAMKGGLRPCDAARLFSVSSAIAYAIRAGRYWAHINV